MKLTIGTRGSNLALFQTKQVAESLKQAVKGLEIEIEIIKTKGDKIIDVPLEKIGDKGLFVKEIEQALIEKRIDFSVNSMKDMPSELPEGLCLTPFNLAEDCRDALVTPHSIESIAELPENAVIATGSVRREKQLKMFRNDIKTVGIRGNVETRIQKMLDNGYDGIILAMAGLNRLQLQNEAYTIIPIDPELMVTAPCQGVLAIEYRANDSKIKKLFDDIADETLTKRSFHEREFLYWIEGGCHAPTGCYTEIHKDNIYMTGIFGNNEKIVKKTINGTLSENRNFGKELALLIKKELG